MSAFVLARNLSLFAALSLCDLGLTGYLLSHSGNTYESNPVAAWWLERFGWSGLVGFKLAVLGLAIVVIIAVARRSPRVAGRVLLFGCTTLLAVVIYSSLLVPGAYAEAEFAGCVEVQGQALEQQQRRYQTYAVVLNCLTNDLLSGQRSLAEAVQTLAREDEVQASYWFEGMSARYPSYSMRELLAIRLMREAYLAAARNGDSSVERARDLAAQFKKCFGRSAPLISPTSERIGEDNPT